MATEKWPKAADSPLPNKRSYIACLYKIFNMFVAVAILFTVLLDN